MRLLDEDGSERRLPGAGRALPAGLPAGAVYALVLVKSWQTERAAGQLAACLAQDGLALTLQNGLGNRETLAAALGAQRVAAGVTTLGATLLGPGRVRLAGEGMHQPGAAPPPGTAGQPAADPPASRSKPAPTWRACCGASW